MKKQLDPSFVGYEDDDQVKIIFTSHPINNKNDTAASNAAADVEIDWGEFDISSVEVETQPVAPAVDFTVSQPSETAEIQWDVTDGSKFYSFDYLLTFEAQDGAICWDIAIEDEGDTKAQIGVDSETLATASSAPEFKPKFALDDPATRKEFIWTLTEVGSSDT